MELKHNLKEYHVVKFYFFFGNLWLLFKNKEILYFLEKESMECSPELIGT